MTGENKFFDDLAKMAGGALGALSGVRGEIEAQIRQQFERVLSQMDVVSREEFEAMKEIAIKARLEQETLAERVAALEARLGTAPADQSS